MSSKLRINKICQHCCNEFIAKTTVTKYCGDNCTKRAYKARKRDDKIALAKEETKKTVQLPIIQIQAKEFLTVAEASIH